MITRYGLWMDPFSLNLFFFFFFFNFFLNLGLKRRGVRKVDE